MPDGAMIGRGCIALDITTDQTSVQKRFLRYEVYNSTIQFYELGSSGTSVSRFDIFNEIGGRSFTTAGGHLALVSLPATPNAAFQPLRLSCSADEFTLSVSQAGLFAERGNTAFKDLSLQFTQSKAGGTLTVGGQVTLVLFGQTILLKPKVVETEGLVFEPEQFPVALAIADLGNLNLTTLKVGTTDDKWAGLQVLYTFDEGSGNTLFDSSSRNSPGDQSIIDLEVSDPSKVQRKPRGLAVTAGAGIRSAGIRSKDKATKLINACRSSNEITIEAWIQPSLLSQPVPDSQPDDAGRGPARIVSLSQNISNRYVALMHGMNNGTPADVYIGRLRTTADKTNRNGNPNNGLPLTTPRGSVKPGLSQVIYSRDKAGTAKIYINSVEQVSGKFEGNLFSIFSGESNPDDAFRLLLANELTGERPWVGEYQRVAIYSRALTKEEVVRSYYPTVQLTATLTMVNVPAPLDTAFPVTVNLENGQFSLNQTGLKIVEPDLLLNEVNLVWNKTAIGAELLSGRVKATLWENPLEFAVSLTADRLRLSLPVSTADRRLFLRGLGTIALSKLDLSADRSVPNPSWNFETDKTAGKGVTFETADQPKVTVIPPPLKGPFPIELWIDAGKLWFSISPAPPSKVVVAPLTFDRADLRFRFISAQDGWEPQSRWQAEKDVTIPLFGQSLSLTPTFEGGVFTLSLPTPSTSLPLTSTDDFGKLKLTQFSLKAATGAVFWQLLMGGYVPLKRADSNEQAGTLNFDAIGQVLAPAAALPQLNRLEGKSFLTSLTTLIFAGDLQAQGDRLLLDGKFSMFPDWSPVKIDQDAQIEIEPDGRLQLHSSTPAQVELADFTLLDAELAFTDGRLTLNGTWLNEPVVLTAIQRDHQFIWQQQDLPFSLPFDLPLSTILGSSHKPHTAVNLDQMRGRGAIAKLLLELSTAGFLSQIASVLQWQAATLSGDLTVPKFILAAPPSTRHTLLGKILQEAKANAANILATSFKNAADYYLEKNKPRIYLGDGAGLSTKPIETILPKVFSLTTQQAADPTAIFQLNQSASECKLIINSANKSPTDLNTAYQAFLAKLADLENTESGLLPGAINLIKCRIAERLPMLLDQILYYYYGFVMEPAKGGQYLDLQPGMRLRVDYQNYQNVPSIDRTAVSGFVGSGTSYYDLTTYLHPQNVGDPLYLMGFNPFIARIQTDIQTDGSKLGVPGIVDLLKPGFRQPYYRLFYPSNFFVASGRPERAVTIAGALNLAEIDVATKEFFEKSGTVANTDKRVSFFFRGRVVVVPEITVFVQDQPVYVPIGTTLRQLLERYSSIPSSNLWNKDSPDSLKQDLRSFQGSFRPCRLVHEGVNSVPSYKFINFDDYRRYDNGMDIFDMPVVKGDRFSF